MSYETYFPEQRHILALAAIRRERFLPERAIGEVEARGGEKVDLRDVVARGAIPARYLMIDAAGFFGLKDTDDLKPMMKVWEGARVEARQVLAGKPNGRGKKLLSPVAGVVAHVGDGRIILEETPEIIEVEAGLTGQVVDIEEGRGVVIETSGAVLQGVWGNNRLQIGTLRAEPSDGLESVGDEMNMQFRGTVVLSRRPLRAAGLRVAQAQSLSGVIAPSMDVSLIDRARELRSAVLLTEGFGAIRMSSFVFGFLEGLIGKQTTVDALDADRIGARRPEIIVNLPVRSGQRPPEPDLNLTLKPGINVRITRGDHAGMVGAVAHLPKTPYLLENGLRVPCAQVQLSAGESAFVPLANLEVFG